MRLSRPRPPDTAVPVVQFVESVRQALAALDVSGAPINVELTLKAFSEPSLTALSLPLFGPRIAFAGPATMTEPIVVSLTLTAAEHGVAAASAEPTLLELLRAMHTTITRLGDSSTASAVLTFVVDSDRLPTPALENDIATRWANTLEISLLKTTNVPSLHRRLFEALFAGRGDRWQNER